MMVILVAISLIASVSLGIITAYTDIRYHKARNKHILVFLLIGFGIQIANLLLAPMMWKSSLINIVLAYGTAIALYAAKVWAAGDAKLFSVMVTLIPFSVYNTKATIIFPAFFVLGVVFCFALLFVFFDSILLFIKEVKSHNLPSWKHLLPQFNREFLLSWGFAFVILDTFDLGLWYWRNQLFAQNPYLLSLINILVVVAIFSFEPTIPLQIGTVCIISGFRLLLFVFKNVVFFRLSLRSILLILIIAIFRKFTSRFNYQTILTANIQQGMVLSQSTVMLFLSSPVKGLPQFTDESTRYRISQEETDAIRRWEQSRQGRGSLIIVRHIPFAPFILMGILLLWVAYFV